MDVDYSFAQLPDTVALNRLPIIITGPGEYVTRSGKRVQIYEVRLFEPRAGYPRHAVTAFEAKGSVWRMYRGKLCPRGLDIWHLSGRYNAQRESPKDIVERR